MPLVFLCWIFSGQGKTNRGTVVIEVTDPAGTGVPHAEVRLSPSPEDGPSKLETATSGKLTVDLKPGSYTLIVACPGFKTSSTPITVRDTAVIQTISVGLQIGDTGSPMVYQGAVMPWNAYPNELPAFRFYETAQWHSLEPLVSTMKDVRRVLGNPQEANDVSVFTEPYPGDDRAKEPVFQYKLNEKWEALVYFTRYCFHQRPKEVAGDRLCSIDLIPLIRVSFDATKLPETFRKKHVVGVDAAWDEYSDGTGLRYEVYTTRPPYGNKQPGDLYRISYGPPVKAPSND